MLLALTTGPILKAQESKLKIAAFEVLTAKCNVCHGTKKRTDIFTMDTMDSLSSVIHEQVFVKKKMPKGRKIKLTDDEVKKLDEWLNSIVSKN